MDCEQAADQIEAQMAPVERQGAPAHAVEGEQQQKADDGLPQCDAERMGAALGGDLGEREGDAPSGPGEQQDRPGLELGGRGHFGSIRSVV